MSKYIVNVVNSQPPSVEAGALDVLLVLALDGFNLVVSTSCQ